MAGPLATMNFLLHRFLAARDLESEIAGIGAMLPDLWRMVDRRVRPMSGSVGTAKAGADLASVLSGIQHHLEVDRWFHSADAFIEGERLTAERLLTSGLSAPKLALFAHVAWELGLDGALVRREGLDNTLRTLREGFDVVGGELAEAAVALHHFDRIDRPPDERRAFDAALHGLLAEITRGRLIGAYQSGAGVARRIDGIRVRLGLPGFTEADRQRLGEVLETISPYADAALKTLTGEHLE
jgi:hypothetical protein